MATAVFTAHNFDVEDAFESLHPGHDSLTPCGALVTPAGIGYFRFVWLLATLSRGYLSTVGLKIRLPALTFALIAKNSFSARSTAVSR